MKTPSGPLALLAVLVSLAVVAGGCSKNTQGDSASPVFLTCDFSSCSSVSP